MDKLNWELRLIETYKPLLSPKKQTYIEASYYHDLSLNEIANIHNVSRAAVHEAITDGIKELYEFEQKLNFLAKQDERIKFISSKIQDNSIINEYLKLETGEK